MCRYIQIELCENSYLLNEKLWKDIISMVDNFTYQIMNIDTRNLSVLDKISMLGFIQEIYFLSKTKEELLEKELEILSQLRAGIENGMLRNISLFGGLCNIGIFLQGLEKETGYFTKFLNSLDSYIVKSTIDLCRAYSANLEHNAVTHYDAISGMSGTAAYLLQRRSESNRKGILEIINYFKVLTKKRKCNGLSIPGWYVSRECLPTEDYRNEYKKGCINFSLSHGIAGPLFILSKAYNNGAQIPGQKEAMERVIEEYERLSWYENGIWYCPGILAPEEYQLNNNRVNKRMSWCYGSISILNSLSIAAKALDNPNRKKWCERMIDQMAHIQMENLGLESPILCHGYAGTAAVFRNLYKYSYSEAVLNLCRRIVEELVSTYNEEYKWGFQDIIRRKKNDVIVVERFDKLNFLEGACGIYSELATYLKRYNSYYDTILLLK